MKLSKRLLTVTALLSATTAANAGIVLAEGFTNITTLAGAGWVQINNSTTGGTTGWFQGDPASAFPAQAGATNSYIAANFNNAGFGGNISNWLLLPVLTLTNGDTLTFFTRTETAPVPGDLLEVRLSTNGASTNVGATTSSLGDFTTLVTTVGSAGYPQTWTQFTSTVSGLAGPTSVRLGFRYVVTDTSINGDIIGIDTVSVNTSTPEPGSLLMLSAGVGLLAAMRARKRV